MINSIAEFASLSSECGVFVRATGENETFLSDVQRLDMCRGAYIRLQKLPQFTSTEASDKYMAVYENMQKSGRADLACVSGNEAFGQRIYAVCLEAAEAFRKAHKGCTPSAEKSFAVKLLFRIDSVLTGLSFPQGVKIVVENSSKLQEYLCCYALSRLGANVLLLMNRCDIDTEAKSLGLSQEMVLGSFGATVLPPFVKRSAPPVNVQPSVNGAQSNAQTGESSAGMVKVTVPPHDSSRSSVPSVSPAPVNAQQGKGVSLKRPDRSGSTQERRPVDLRHPDRAAVQPSVPQNAPQANTPARRAPIERPPQNSYTPIQRPGQNIGFAPIQRPSQDIAYTQIQRPENIAYTPITPPNVQARPELSYEELATRAASVVQILVIASPRDISPNGEIRAKSSGSGVMIGEDGYIVTNCHVAAGGKIYAVRIENDERVYFTDRLVKYNDRYDLAVLKIDRKLAPLPVYSGSKPLARGQKVVAIGSPLGMFNTVSDGIISGIRRMNGVEMIQFTAPISPGSSGGAVMNMYGEVIGISTAGIESDDGSAQNLNLAVGSDTISLFCRGFFNK